MSEWWEVGYPGQSPPVGPGKLARPLYEGDTGPDVEAVKRAVSRLGRWPWQKFDQVYSEGFARGKAGGNVRDSGVAGVQRQQGIQATGNVGDATYQALRYACIPKGLSHAGERAFDAAAIELLEQSHDLSSAPDLGPVYAGGTPVLDQDCTHATGGIPLYPAFDDCWTVGRSVIAPEGLVVVGQSSAEFGDAFYADGDSGCKWWFGHLSSSPPNGRRYRVGEVIGYVVDPKGASAPHVHTGLNVEALFGKGKQLTHHTNYTHGAPLIGKQLAAGRPL
jgi:hypothetical protein